MTTQPAHIGAPVRRGLNGRIVLLSLLAFFGVIFFVNGFMIYMAISTLGGVETQSSYKAGQAFAADVEAAREQSERHWQVEEAVRRIDTDFVAILVTAHDASTAPLAGYRVNASFHHPADARADREVALVEQTPGRYESEIKLGRGEWDVVLDIFRDDVRLFRSRNRVDLR